MRIRLLLPALAALITLIAAPAPAGARVPQGFVGMMADGPLLSPTINLPHQLDQMVASGVENLRLAFNWAAMQPYQSVAQVPATNHSSYTDVGGVPTYFAETDRVIGLAAQRHLPVLPVALYTPSWAAKDPGTFGSPPASDATYAAFAAALVQRYGPHGTFWSAHRSIPRLPIRTWQIWNEPDLPQYWSEQPFYKSYVALLRAARTAIKRVDPGATIVLAGMPDFVWKYLAGIYAVPGARSLFDIVAVHPYTALTFGVIVFLQKVRDVMNRNGDKRKPILATEVSWPSSLGQMPKADLFGFETTASGQAAKLRTLLPLLARHRAALGLLGFYYYTWLGYEYTGDTTSFDYAGLFRMRSNRLVAKPAFAAFSKAALALESCKRKSSVANRCAQKG
jgi:hypothetical protein